VLLLFFCHFGVLYGVNGNMISGFEVGKSGAISLFIIHAPIHQEFIWARVVEIGAFFPDGFFVCQYDISFWFHWAFYTSRMFNAAFNYLSIIKTPEK